VAGTTAAENTRELNKDGNITIVTDEDLSFYYIIRLNEYLSGDLIEQKLPEFSKNSFNVWHYNCLTQFLVSSFE